MKVRVLCVDDDFGIPLLIKKMLSVVPNLEVITCMDPMDALDKIAANPDIKAVITDFMMPGFTGLEVLVVVQQRSPNVRRILITAAPNEPEVREAVKSGLVEYIIDKPMGRGQLKAALKGLL